MRNFKLMSCYSVTFFVKFNLVLKYNNCHIYIQSLVKRLIFEIIFTRHDKLHVPEFNPQH